MDVTGGNENYFQMLPTFIVDDRVVPRLPEEVLKRYEKWKDIVRLSGPAGLRQIKRFMMNPPTAPKFRKAYQSLPEPIRAAARKQ